MVQQIDGDGSTQFFDYFEHSFLSRLDFHYLCLDVLQQSFLGLLKRQKEADSNLEGLHPILHPGRDHRQFRILDPFASF